MSDEDEMAENLILGRALRSFLCSEEYTDVDGPQVALDGYWRVDAETLAVMQRIDREWRKERA